MRLRFRRRILVLHYHIDRLGLEVDESELRKRMVPWTSSAAST